MIIIPYQKYIIESHLTINEIVIKLQKNTTPKKFWGNEEWEKKFEGLINTDWFFINYISSPWKKLHWRANAYDKISINGNIIENKWATNTLVRVKPWIVSIFLLLVSLLATFYWIAVRDYIALLFLPVFYTIIMVRISYEYPLIKKDLEVFFWKE